MTINQREIIIAEYSIEKDWINKIPNSNWLCILVDNDKERKYLDEVISKIINKDVCYICTIGQSCKKTHDLIDEEIIFREVDIEKLYLPVYHIMTTWHTDFSEGIWFAIFAAHHDEIIIKKIVVLDMTEGKELIRINKLITDLQGQGQN